MIVDMGDRQIEWGDFFRSIVAAAASSQGRGQSKWREQQRGAAGARQVKIHLGEGRAVETLHAPLA